MTTIAIVGAGPSLGLSIAKVFGHRGFTVALLSRNAAKLELLVRELASHGIDSAAFPADVANHPQLEQALHAAKKHFGQIDVLEYSPLANFGFTYATETTLRPQVESLLRRRNLGPSSPSRHARQARRHDPAHHRRRRSPPLHDARHHEHRPSRVRNWAHNLHNSLRDKGIYVANIAINLMITTRPPAGVRHMDPDTIAQSYWDMYTTRSEAERLIQ